MEAYSSDVVANWLLKRAEESGNKLTPMQLIKLVYLAHGWMLALHSRPLLNESVEAWRYGPVIRPLYDQVKKHGSQPVEPIKVKRQSDLDEDALSILEQVYEVYGQLAGTQLSSLTHQANTPWSLTWESKGMSEVISNDLIESHFKSLSK